MKTWLVAIAACISLLTANHATLAEPVWRTAVTPNYRVISELDDRDTTEWMRSFDQFILSTTDVLRMNVHSAPPLTVVIFAHNSDYEPYKMLRPNGRSANVAGQFIRHPSWSMIGMAYTAGDAPLRATLQHEATHWLMSADPSPQPAWFSEGIAEMFSTFDLEVNRVSWAKPIDDHLELLHTRGTTPLGPFLAEPSAIFDRDDRTDQFYAQAWAFTHFLMLGDKGAHRAQLTQFLAAFRTRSGEESVKEVFGTDLSALEKAFLIYIDQRSFPYMYFPAKAAPPPPPLQPASPALVQASLGFLALGAERNELARQHAEKAISLDDNEPGGHAILAYLDWSTRDLDKATTHAEAAVARGSRDSDLYLLLGDSYTTLNGANFGKPNAMATATGLYEQAINLNPRRQEAFDQLVTALVRLEKPREEDGKFIDLGLKVFPTDDWLRVGRANVAYRLGQHDEALSSLDAVLQPGSSLNEMQRSYTSDLRQHLLLDGLNADLRSAIDKGDITAARAVVAHYREALTGNARALEYLDTVSQDLNRRQNKPAQSTGGNSH